MGGPIFWVEITADEPVIKERVSKKREFSEADFDVYLKIKETFEPLEQDHLTLRVDQYTLEEMIERTKSYYAIALWMQKRFINLSKKTDDRDRFPRLHDTASGGLAACRSARVPPANGGGRTAPICFLQDL